MNQNLKVTVVYRDKNLDPTYERSYFLKDYTDMIRMNLIRVISDIEDLIYIMNDNKSKQDWSDDVWVKFQHIKHKILDNAGSIGRLPDDIGGGDNEKTAMGNE